MSNPRPTQAPGRFPMTTPPTPEGGPGQWQIIQPWAADFWVDLIRRFTEAPNPAKKAALQPAKAQLASKPKVGGRYPIQKYYPTQDIMGAGQGRMTANLIADRGINLGDRDFPYSYVETPVMQLLNIPHPGGPQGTGYRVPIGNSRDLLAELVGRRNQAVTRPPLGLGGAGG